MKFMRRPLLLLELLCVLIVSAFVAVPTAAQVYPTTNPTYTPTAILPATTLTVAPGTVVFNNNGNGTLFIRIGGSFTSFAGTFQVTEARTSPSWTNIGAQLLGGARYSAITQAGLYRLNISGAAQVRFNLTALSGTNVIVSAAATGVDELMTMVPAQRPTYHAAAAVTTAASLTDFFSISNPSALTVRITRVSCTGTATAIGTGTLFGIVRSSADSGGTSSTVTIAPSDQTNPVTPGAVATTWTANPGTLGTSVGNARIQTIVFTPTATTTIGTNPVVWEFGGPRSLEQEIVLRSAGGTAQSFSLGGAGTAMPAGASVNCSVTWTEE